jgi:hypothetical protein
MGRTANYQNLGLRIFITRDDFLVLLRDGEVFCDLWYRGAFVGDEQVYVLVSPQTQELLTEWYNNERQALDPLKRAREDKYRETQLDKERRQGAKKRRRVQRATDHVPEVE